MSVRSPGCVLFGCADLSRLGAGRDDALSRATNTDCRCAESDAPEDQPPTSAAPRSPQLPRRNTGRRCHCARNDTSFSCRCPPLRQRPFRPTTPPAADGTAATPAAPSQAAVAPAPPVDPIVAAVRVKPRTRLHRESRQGRYLCRRHSLWRAHRRAVVG